MIYFFTICMPFLSAPSFYSIFGSIAFFSLLVSSFFAISALFRRRAICFDKYQLYLMLLFLIYLTFSFLLNVLDKSLQYYIFYLFFIVSVFSASYWAKNSIWSYNKLNKVVFYLVIFMFLFSFIEYYYIYNNGGYISWIPRYDRPIYGSNSFSNFYRIRLFTYESSSAGFVINLLFLAYFLTSDRKYLNKNDLLFVFSSTLLQIFIFSTTQFLMFIAILCFVFFTKASKKIIILHLMLLFFLMLYKINDIFSIFNYIFDKITIYTGQSSDFGTSSSRNEFLLIGFRAFLDNPIIGGGLSSFYNYIDTGLVNFHLQTLQQLGIIGYLLFSLVLFFPLFHFKHYKIELKLMFICMWITLFFSGSIWDSTIYFPYFFVKRDNLNV